MISSEVIYDAALMESEKLRKGLDIILIQFVAILGKHNC